MSGDLGNVCVLSRELRNERDLKRTRPLLIFATVNERIVSGDLGNWTITANPASKIKIDWRRSSVVEASERGRPAGLRRRKDTLVRSSCEASDSSGPLRLSGTSWPGYILATSFR